MIRNVVSLVFFSLALPTEAFAEDTSTTSPADEMVEPAPAPRYPHPLTRRNTGVVLTATGAACLGSGAALLLGSTIIPQTGTSQAYSVFFGGIMSGISVPFLAPGIPLWVSGNKRMKEDPPRFDAHLHVVPGPRPTVAVGGRF